MFKGASQPVTSQSLGATSSAVKRKRRSSGVQPLLEDAPVYSFGETPEQDPSISHALIETLRTQYKSFLQEQQKAGAGPLTGLEAKQLERTKYIENIDQHFENLKFNQSASRWEELLMLFVNYRIKLYLENEPFSKAQSTFGDALRAVQMHLLQTLEVLRTKNPSSPMLNQLLDTAKTQAGTALNRVNAVSPSQADEIKKRAAAFGCHEALRSFAPGLVNESKQVNMLAFRLGAVAVPESPLICSGVFKGKRRNNDETYSDSPKKARRDFRSALTMNASE